MSVTSGWDDWASSLDELADLRVMKATVESGARVLIGTVTLDGLMADDAFPDDLVYIAVLESAAATLPEMARELRDGGEQGVARVKQMSRDLLAMRDRICLRALRAGGYPAGAAEEVLEQLDEYDRAMIADLAQRKIVEDASGRRFGAETLTQFRGADPEPSAGDAAGEARAGEGLDVPEVLEG